MLVELMLMILHTAMLCSVPGSPHRSCSSLVVKKLPVTQLIRPKLLCQLMFTRLAELFSRRSVDFVCAPREKRIARSSCVVDTCCAPFKRAFHILCAPALTCAPWSSIFSHPAIAVKKVCVHQWSGVVCRHGGVVGLWNTHIFNEKLPRSKVTPF